MSRNVKPVLERALDLIRDPEHWIKGEEAVDASEGGVDFNDEFAVKFCMVGSVRRAMWDLKQEGTDCYLYSDYLNTLGTLGKFLPDVGMRCVYHGDGCDCRCLIPNFNDDDHTTHEDVLLVFKHAIHALEEME